MTLWAIARTGSGARRGGQVLLTFLTLLYSVFLAGIALSGAAIAVGLGGDTGHASSPVPPRSPRPPPSRPGSRSAAAAHRPCPRSAACARPPRCSAARSARRSRTCAAATPRLLGAPAWWAFDAAVLWAAFHALGEPPALPILAFAYFAGQVGNTIPVPGAASGGMVGTLLAFGVAPDLALSAVLTYRVVAIWIPAPLGLAALGALKARVGRWDRDEADSPAPAPLRQARRNRRRGRHVGFNRGLSGHAAIMGRPANAMTLQEELPAASASVAAARRLLRRFAGDLAVDLDAVELAVSEAVANAVVHAYDDGRGTVELQAAAAPYELQIVVRDHGCGMYGIGSEGGAGFGLHHPPARPPRGGRRRDPGRRAHDDVPARRPLGAPDGDPRPTTELAGARSRTAPPSILACCAHPRGRDGRRAPRPRRGRRGGPHRHRLRRPGQRLDQRHPARRRTACTSTRARELPAALSSSRAVANGKRTTVLVAVPARGRAVFGKFAAAPAAGSPSASARPPTRWRTRRRCASRPACSRVRSRSWTPVRASRCATTPMRSRSPRTRALRRHGCERAGITVRSFDGAPRATSPAPASSTPSRRALRRLRTGAPSSTGRLKVVDRATGAQSCTRCGRGPPRHRRPRPGWHLAETGRSSSCTSCRLQDNLYCGKRITWYCRPSRRARAPAHRLRQRLRAPRGGRLVFVVARRSQRRPGHHGSRRRRRAGPGALRRGPAGAEPGRGGRPRRLARARVPGDSLWVARLGDAPQRASPVPVHDGIPRHTLRSGEDGARACAYACPDGCSAVQLRSGSRTAPARPRAFTRGARAFRGRPR